MEKIKSGYLNPETGLVFCHYGKSYPNGEYWMTPEKYAKRVERKKQKHNERYINDQSYKQRILNRSKSLASKEKEKERKSTIKYKQNRKTYIKKWFDKKYNCDELFALKMRLRARLKFALHQKKLIKSKKTEKYLGTKIENAREFIEHQFELGMSWENRNEWYIDHFFPIAIAKNEKDILPLIHFTNLRPMWANENVKKSASIPSAQEIIKRNILIENWINKKKEEYAKN